MAIALYCNYVALLVTHSTQKQESNLAFGVIRVSVVCLRKDFLWPLILPGSRLNFTSEGHDCSTDRSVDGTVLTHLAINKLYQCIDTINKTY